jgi:protein-S-isoprenylcysteine O-methyltransferase Ste14
VHIFPPAIPLVTILLGIGLDYLIPLGDRYTPVGRASYGVGAALVLGAVLGLGWGAVRLVRGSGQSENSWKPTTEIIQRGPFRISRNPTYLQMVPACVGFARVRRWI